MPRLAGKHYKIFILRILFVFLIYELTRLLFYLFNRDSFADLSCVELIKIFIYGLRFDAVPIIVLNGIYILMSIIPFNYQFGRKYTSVSMWVYVICNSLAIATNLMDTGYYRFSSARSTSDIFSVLFLGNDINNLIWQYILDYWYLFLIWAGIIFGFYFVFRKTQQYLNKTIELIPVSKKLFFVQFSLALFILFIGFIGVRGGFQLRPLGIVTAGNYTTSKNIALILNTPFTIIKTYGKSGLSEEKYFDNKNLRAYFDPLKKPKARKSNKENVVIIVLEGFSNEYMGFLSHKKSYTPFLDSLMSQSLVFTNAFANGKRSIEAIPSVLSGIPSLMNEAYTTSRYSGNTIESIATFLKKMGYNTSFFHGGTNGTMGFDNYTKIAGFDKYFGRKEYNNENDFDGKWGIFDEPFLQFICKNISSMPQPFFTTVFTLSSHHPYQIPIKYNSLFEEGSLPIHKSIRYADFSLKKFFEQSSKYAWFENTLFIITSDHTSELEYPEYQTRSGKYRIPLIFYKKNSNLIGISEITAQQIDILPSVLNYVGNTLPYISFGNDLLDSLTHDHFSINYSDETYQFISGDYSLQFDGKNTIGLYNIKTDSLMKSNLVGKGEQVEQLLSNKLKAIIQVYNFRMIHNKLSSVD